MVILILWGLGFWVGQAALQPEFMVNAYAAIATGVTALASLISYVWLSKKYIFAGALTSYILLSVTALIIISTTGDMASPFIALWMIVAVFCGLFGLAGFLPTIVLAGGYSAYLVIALDASQWQLTVFGLAFLLPILVSYFIWHTSNRPDSEDKTFSALAQELSQVANKSEIVINAIADGVVALDGKGVIQLINPAAQSTIGWEKNDAMELDYRSVLKLLDANGDTLAPEVDPISQAIQQNSQIYREDLMIMTSSGKKILISLHISPVGMTGSGVILVFRDITAKATEEREQAEFVSTASHEMRTPVAAIEGYLGLALNPQTASIDDKARMYLAKAHESAQHLGRLFQDLLDISKVEDGRLNNTPVILDVVASARSVTEALVPSAQAKSLTLVFRPDIQSPAASRISPVFYAMVDSDHFREVLSNFIENAIKYTKAGDVSVDVKGDNENVTISVSDTGIGIPKEDIGHLFQKFYRVDNSETREIGGTGLGLYLSRRLVEAMSGRVWVESEYGKGSTFFMEFSRMSHEEAMDKLDQQTASAAAAQQLQSVPQQQIAAPVQPPAPAVAPTPQPTQPVVSAPQQPIPPAPNQPPPPPQP